MIGFIKRLCLFEKFVLLGCLFLAANSAASYGQAQQRSIIGKGWHSWYEVKVDPEDPRTLMVCGSKWDPQRNALFGFVYVSSDGGSNWRTAFEDRSTAWVGEHSCAVGKNHILYFVSEASRVIDGSAHHELGTARLYVSNDRGQTWTKTTETGWADYSTSAVSTTTGELVTFFNNAGTHDKGMGWGSTVGALVFSEKGTKISGPFVNPAMKQQNYQGVLPSQAIALKDGSVAALYGGPRDTSRGFQYDVGFVRFESESRRQVNFSVLTTMKQKCFSLDGHALAYDSSSNQLIIAYSEESTAERCHLSIAVSADEGKTWVRKPVANAPPDLAEPMNHLAMAVGADSTIGFQWETSGRWFFSKLKNLSYFEPATELDTGIRVPRVTDDSMMTFVFPAKGFYIGVNTSSPLATINVRSMPGVVLRSLGLYATSAGYHVIVPVVEEGYEALGMIGVSAQVERNSKSSSAISSDDREEDVTSEIVLLNGRVQSFDNATGTLTIDLRLANRGDRPIRLPIRIEAREISSNVGTVSVLNSDNNIHGPGATWDVSQSVTGNQLYPGSATYNSFRLTFRVDLRPKSLPSDNFLNLKVRVVGAK